MNQKVKIRFGADGIHFFNKNSGTNILLDEHIPPPKLWSLAPRQVSIALTNLCDLSCLYCYAPKNSLSINSEKILKWAIELDENGCIGIGFGGGEPTLYPNLVKLCSEISKKTNLAISMTTHAHHVKNGLLEELSKYLNFIRISMDGIGSTYENLRGRSFNELINNIKEIKKNIPFAINYVVNSETIKELDEGIKISESLGASEFLLLPEEQIGKGKGIKKEVLEYLQNWVNNYNGAIPLSISEGMAEGFVTCSPFTIEKGLKAFAHIDASGKIKKTSFCSDGIFIENDGVISALNKLNNNSDKEGNNL